MDVSEFHFAQTAWLWGLLAIPAVLALYTALERTKGQQLLQRFADPHLLPHLLKRRGTARRRVRVPLMIWALAWTCGMVAMAGPRWDYTDEQTFQPTQDLVIVLDLSQSMNATDVKPSRIARARQEIEDLLDMSHGTSIGLVAYAAVPHMVTPLTDDVRTIRNLLPELDTSLVTIQGDRLKPALEMAADMLRSEAGNAKSILVIGDGGFEENDFADLAGATGGATIFTMGIGTPGAPGSGSLQADRLQRLAAAGHGQYVEASYTDSDTRAILDQIGSAGSKAQATPASVRVWEERFYIPALLLAALLLPFFRRGAFFPLIAFLAMTLFADGQVQAATAADLFLNKQQQARAAFDKGDYKDAMAKFDTPYRRGVAAYKAGAYDKAAALFKVAAAQKNGLDALYNLGNAQLMLGQIQDAIVDYEGVLKQRPNDVAARHNLDIALKMLGQNPQQKKPQDKQDKKDNDNKQNKQGQQPQNSKGGGQNKQQGQRPQQQAQNGKNNAQNKPPGQQPPQQQGQNGQKPNPGGGAQSKAGQQPSSRQSPSQQGPSQQAKSQPAQQQPGQQGSPPQVMRPAMASNVPRRTQRDVNADEWLGRVQSDPGSFLKNQFMIEEQESGLQQGAPP
jgi:Ca-activated chloride channel family protein